VRLYRDRRRERLRLLTLEMPETAIAAAIARGFLKPEDSTQAWSVAAGTETAVPNNRTRLMPSRRMLE
jgi:hypothetical protein